MSRFINGCRLLALTTLFAGCGATVHPGEVGLKYRAFRNPAFENKVLTPGYYPLLAWNKLVVYDITSRTRDEEVAVLTADNLHVPVTVAVTYHPVKEDVYTIHTTVGPAFYEKLLGPQMITLVRAEFSKHMHNDLAKESPIIEQVVHDRLQESSTKYNIIVDQVAIRHIDYDDTVTQAISRKIAVRQQSEQKKYEVDIAQRDAEIARTTAQGRSDATRIQAEGDAAAIVARGKAQAEAQDAVAKTLTPEYLQFKAFDNHNASYFFVPTGKGGLPIIVDAKPPTR
ncbi:MAG TPA: SPFH domain-containing protein [Nannocystaceae bacterium]|nr:SPFH domain-containing protein [Nannocystaceae bacterium]